MKVLTLTLLLAGAFTASAMNRLDALWMLETGGDDHVVGKAGEISRYQVRTSVWHSVTPSRAYTSPETARMVVAQVMDRRVQKFDQIKGRQPTDFEYYALWNAPGQAYSGHISRTVAARCRRFSNLCSLPLKSPEARH